MKICGYDNLGNFLEGKMTSKVIDAFGRVLIKLESDDGKTHTLISKCPCQINAKTQDFIPLKKKPAEILFSGHIYEAEPMYLKKHMALVKIKEPFGKEHKMVEIPLSQLFYVDK